MTEKKRNVAASVRARLLNLARERGDNFQLVLQRYAMEGLLRRLASSKLRDRFILKGAGLFAVWGHETYRPTRDIDLLGFGDPSPDAVAASIREVCAAEIPDDGLEFLAETIEAGPIREEAEYGGVRVRLSALLEQARISVQIDVGFGDAVVPEEVEYPVLLDAPVPRLRAYPREVVVAEKLHAMVLLGETNSRMKDFYDVFVLSRVFTFDGPKVVQAVTATFKRRNMELPPAAPVALTTRFYEDAARDQLWRAFLDRTGLSSAPRNLADLGPALQAFLVPVLDAAAGRRQSPLAWRAGGSWG